MVKILYWYLKNFTGRELGRTNGSRFDNDGLEGLKQRQT